MADTHTSTTTSTDNDLPPYVTTQQLAERWGLSAGHLANLRCEATGPKYVTFGSAVRYARAEILRCEREGWVR